MKNRDCKYEVDPILVDFRASFTIKCTPVKCMPRCAYGMQHIRVLVGYENELEKVFNQEITVTRDKEEHLSRPGEYIKTNLSYHVMNKVNRNHRKEERQSRNRTDHSRVSWNIFSLHIMFVHYIMFV